jgi:hypothetical protein
MKLDALFWRIVGLEENDQLPLSFRVFGAWTCHVPPLHEQSLLDDELSSAEIADASVAWAEDKLEKLSSTLNSAMLIRHLRGAEARGGLLSASLVTLLILENDEDEAARICRDGLAAGEAGGFSVSSQDRSISFYEMALRFMRAG